MGNLREEIYTIFRSSVSFKPPKDIRTFIENFIAENIEMNVDGMKLNIQAYKKMENLIINLLNQIELLEENNDKYDIYENTVNKS